MTTAPGNPDTLVLRRSLLAVLAIAPVAVLLGALARGWHGVGGALVGSALTLGFFGLTVLVVQRTRSASLETLRVAVMGSFLAKLLLAVVAVAVVSRVPALDSKVFALTVVVGVLVFLGAEAALVLGGRAPTVPLAPRATSPAAAADDDQAVAAARAARRPEV